jgi:SAM-dependent methyltransferase
MQTSNNLQEWFGGIDIYLFDQLLKGRIVPGMRVLDAGCGAGRNLVYLLRSGYEVFGVDESARQIAQVRQMAAALAPHLPAENFRVEPVERMSWGALSDPPANAGGTDQSVERLSADYSEQKAVGRRQEADGRRQNEERIAGRMPALPGGRMPALPGGRMPALPGGRMSSTPSGLPAWGPRPALPGFDVVLSSAVLHFARDEEHWQAMVNEMWRVLKPGGMLFARLASTIGVEGQIALIEGRRYRLPDGSDRFLVDAEMLHRVTAALGGEFLEPIKTTVVENMRAMTTWVLRKK